MQINPPDMACQVFKVARLRIEDHYRNDLENKLYRPEIAEKIERRLMQAEDTRQQQQQQQQQQEEEEQKQQQQQEEKGSGMKAALMMARKMSNLLVDDATKARIEHEKRTLRDEARQTRRRSLALSINSKQLRRSKKQPGLSDFDGD